MQFSPALPWAQGTRGTILLQSPISHEDLVNGALQIKDGTRELLSPAGSSDEVMYGDYNEQVMSIQIAEGESLAELPCVVNEGSISSIERITPLGFIAGTKYIDAQGQEVSTQGQDCYLGLADDDGNLVALFSQDGRTIVKAKKAQDSYCELLFDGLFDENTIFESETKPGTEALANLPLVYTKIIANSENEFVIKPLYEPSGSLALFDNTFSRLSTQTETDTVYIQ